LRIKSIALLSRTWLICLLLLFTLNSSLLTQNSIAQHAGKYDYYRYLQTQAVEADPLGFILGRVSAQYEQRLDPNFTRTYEFAWQRELGDKNVKGYYHESGVSIGAMERIYLVDNAAMLGNYAGVGAGLGLIDKTISFRLTAEVGYKYCFGGGKGHYFVEPKFIMDAYLFTNRIGKRILPLVALPVGYAWW
jgi:hypothetical protein